MGITISSGSLSTLINNPTSIPGYSATGTVEITGQITVTEAN